MTKREYMEAYHGMGGQYGEGWAEDPWMGTAGRRAPLRPDLEICPPEEERAARAERDRLAEEAFDLVGRTYQGAV